MVLSAITLESLRYLAEGNRKVLWITKGIIPDLAMAHKKYEPRSHPFAPDTYWQHLCWLRDHPPKDVEIATTNHQDIWKMIFI